MMEWAFFVRPGPSNDGGLHLCIGATVLSTGELEFAVTGVFKRF